jgi:transposase
MRPYLTLVDVTPEEQAALDAAVHAPKTFTRRRAQILRLSAQGVAPRIIAEGIGCSEQTVRNAIHAFVEQGITSLEGQTMGPKTSSRSFDEATSQRLLAIAHQSPRTFGKARSTWTLDLLAQVSLSEKLTPTLVSIETIRQAIIALGSSWQRAKHWISSPDPQYALKKSSETA